ncbi:hypothetical protein LCGC14_0783930 [marine sediment metagenome]|uniref:Methyltransferase domain-containing protein n=1 Tax=marine sediment metagenome TaxID=412755 RepID=A0A0F9QEJ8_9ZZZZ
MILINPLPDPLIECDFETVYFPSEDSFLLLDHFRKSIKQTNFDGIDLREVDTILDMGTGTGIIAIFFQMLKSIIKGFNPRIYASDILEESILCAKKNATLNNFTGQITFYQSDLFTNFPSNLKSSFNIITFNPPYLPSSEFIKHKKKIDYSWNGGSTGFELLLRFLKEAKLYLNLKKKHYIYCISSSNTDLDMLNKEIMKLGYRNEVLRKTHFFFEDICLHRLRRLRD